MDDSRKTEAGTPQVGRFVSDLELMKSLNQCLWEVERKRVQEGNETPGEP